MAGSGGIFVSYRRADTAAATGRLADLLIGRFGPARVFMDVDTIAPGQNFAAAINGAASGCDVLLAPIGPKWLDAVDEYGRRRIDQPDDFVALEIGLALERGIVVIPILVDGSAMVRSAELPEGLKGLAARHAVTLDHATFAVDAERILESVDRVLATEELRRAEHVSQGRPRRTSEDSADSVEDIPALLLGRVKRRKRLWWTTYALSILFASVPASFINSRVDAVSGVLAMFLVLGGLAWCASKLRREIATERLLIDQLPAAVEIEPIRRAVSQRHVAQIAVICLLVSLAIGVGMAISRLNSPAPTKVAALRVLTTEIDRWVASSSAIAMTPPIRLAGSLTSLARTSGQNKF